MKQPIDCTLECKPRGAEAKPETPKPPSPEPFKTPQDVELRRQASLPAIQTLEDTILALRSSHVTQLACALRRSCHMCGFMVCGLQFRYYVTFLSMPSVQDHSGGAYMHIPYT